MIEVEARFILRSPYSNEVREVDPKYIKELAERFGTSITWETKLIGSFSPITRYLTPRALPEEAVMRVRGSDEVSVKETIKELIKRYGEPDIPYSIWGKGRWNRRFLNAIIKEMRERKEI